jgi:hypothetical protein
MRAALAALLVLLTGCSLGPPIAAQAVDYNRAVETAANTLLLTNILRARDERPLHFTSVPQIRGSIQIGLNQPGIGLPVAGSQQGLNLGLNAATSPSFDVSALDTQEFIRGLLEPLEPGIVRYYWDRGYPDQMLLMLMFSWIQHPGTGRRLQLDPRCWLDRPDCPDGPNRAEVLRQVMRETLAFGRPIFHDYTAVIPLGPPLAAGQAGDPALLAMAAEGRLRLVPVPGGRWQAFRLEPRVANCRRLPFGSGSVTAPMGTTDPAALARGNAPECVAPEVLEPARITTAPSPARAEQVYIRSVQEIIRFLGILARVQADLPRRPDGSPSCVTIDLTRGRPACLFQLLAGKGPVGAVTVEYEGETFHLPPFREPGEGGQVEGDHSMRILSLLSDLVNLKKSSSSIPSTRAVQIVR